MKNYNEISNEFIVVDYEKLHKKLNILFTDFRENNSYLKNIWFKIKYTSNSDYFELDIIWFYSNKTTKLISDNSERYSTIYKFNRIIDKLYIINNILKHNEYIEILDNLDFIIPIIEQICNIDIKKYIDYKSGNDLIKMINTNFLILDYDKFLINFEEELKKTGSINLYNYIDKLFYKLNYVDYSDIKYLLNDLKYKYKYIIDSEKYNL